MERFNQAIAYLKSKGKVHKQQDIADKIGVSKSYFSDALKNRGGKFSEDFLRRFAKAYAELISEEWLVNGSGRMEIPDPSLRPHFEANAAAGFLDGASSAENGFLIPSLSPLIGEYDFTIGVDGRSMEPEFRSGDIVACKRVRDRVNLPMGKVCVFDTKEGALLKVLKGVRGHTVILHSLNPDYPDLRVEGESILSVGLVVAVIRRGPTF